MFWAQSANGRVKRSERLYSRDYYAEPNLLFRGTENGVFELVQPRGGTRPELIATSRAAAFGDVNNDGGVDILVINRDGPPHLLINSINPRGHWLMLRLVDGKSDAIGATVTLRVGERTITREVRSAYSYLAANDPRVHVGLGRYREATAVRVRWVDGSVESFGRLSGDRIVTLRRGEGKRDGDTVP